MKKGFLLLITLLIIVLFSSGIIAQSEIPELVTDVGTTLNSDISDWLGGLGISVRLPR